MKNQGFREPQIELEWARRCRGEVAFLRHKVPGIIHDEASDWDLAVRDLEQVRSVTRDLLGEPWVLVPRTFVEQRYFAWGQIDFLPRFEWNGICYLQAERFWSGVSVREDGLPRPRVAHDAFVVWMTGLLWGGLYRTKYDQFLQRALQEDGEEFEDCLSEAFGVDLGREMIVLVENQTPGEAQKWVGRLRNSLRSRAFFQRPTETLETVIRHWTRELVLHCKPPYPWISVLGPDESRQSALIKVIEQKLERSRLKILTFRWCPGQSGDDRSDSPHESPPGGPRPRGFFGSTLQLMVLWLRWMRERWGRTWHRRSKEKILFSNRHYLDLVVNPGRYRYGGSARLARWCFRFFPKPDLILVLAEKPDSSLPVQSKVPVVVLNQMLEPEILGEEAFREIREKLFGDRPGQSDQDKNLSSRES